MGTWDLAPVRAMLDGLQEYECAIEADRAHWPIAAPPMPIGCWSNRRKNSGAILIAEADAVV